MANGLPSWSEPSWYRVWSKGLIHCTKFTCLGGHPCPRKPFLSSVGFLFQKLCHSQTPVHQNCKWILGSPCCAEVHGVMSWLALKRFINHVACLNAHDHQGLFVENSTPTFSLRWCMSVPAKGRFCLWRFPQGCSHENMEGRLWPSLEGQLTNARSQPCAAADVVLAHCHTCKPTPSAQPNLQNLTVLSPWGPTDSCFSMGSHEHNQWMNLSWPNSQQRQCPWLNWTLAPSLCMQSQNWLLQVLISLLHQCACDGQLWLWNHCMKNTTVDMECE